MTPKVRKLLKFFASHSLAVFGPLEHFTQLVENPAEGRGWGVGGDALWVLGRGRFGCCPLIIPGLLESELQDP